MQFCFLKKNNCINVSISSVIQTWFSQKWPISVRFSHAQSHTPSNCGLLDINGKKLQGESHHLPVWVHFYVRGTSPGPTRLCLAAWLHQAIYTHQTALCWGSLQLVAQSSFSFCWPVLVSTSGSPKMGHTITMSSLLLLFICDAAWENPA